MSSLDEQHQGKPRSPRLGTPDAYPALFLLLALSLGVTAAVVFNISLA